MKRYAVGAAALAALGLVACEPYQGNESGPKTAILGDSITDEAHDPYHTWLDDTYYLSVSGVSGASVDERQDDAEVYATTNPDAAVINLGSNDAYRDYPAWITIWNLSVMGQTFPNSCVIYTTITTDSPWEYFNEQADEVNTWIRSLSSEGYIILDWDAETDEGVTYDGLHPNYWGQLGLIQLTEQALEECP